MKKTTLLSIASILTVSFSVSVVFSFSLDEKENQNSYSQTGNSNVMISGGENTIYQSKAKRSSDEYVVGGTDGGQAMMFDKPTCNPYDYLGFKGKNKPFKTLRNRTLVKVLTRKNFSKCTLWKVKSLEGQYKGQSGWVASTGYDQFSLPN